MRSHHAAREAAAQTAGGSMAMVAIVAMVAMVAMVAAG
jgi:hypothetical protein